MAYTPFVNERAQAVFSILLASAKRGERCPTNIAIATALHKRGIKAAGSSMASVVASLVAGGHLQLRIYRHSWRQVVIHEGSDVWQTEGPADAPGPYTVFDQHGRRDYLGDSACG